MSDEWRDAVKSGGDFNPLKMREGLNAMLPPQEPRVLGVKLSAKKNIVLFTETPFSIGLENRWEELRVVHVIDEERWETRSSVSTREKPTSRVQCIRGVQRLQPCSEAQSGAYCAKNTREGGGSSAVL